jgi:hypothetical protein
VTDDRVAVNPEAERPKCDICQVGFNATERGMRPPPSLLRCGCEKAVWHWKLGCIELVELALSLQCLAVLSLVSPRHLLLCPSCFRPSVSVSCSVCRIVTASVCCIVTASRRGGSTVLCFAAAASLFGDKVFCGHLPVCLQRGRFVKID